MLNGLILEWHDPIHPVDTIAYVDDLQVAEKEAIGNGYEGIVKVA